MRLSTIKVAGADALRVLDERRARYPETREYPFLIGDAEDLNHLKEYMEYFDGEAPRDPATILLAASNIDPAAWVEERRAENEGNDYAIDENFVGSWPDEEVEKVMIHLHQDILTGEIHPEVYQGLAIVDEPWQLLAVLGYGDWNLCPPPEVHAAFHRAWFGKYGAEIVGVSNDVVECLVKSPPRDREAAMQLAREQYWYCPDIVEQGCGTISRLAATLLDSPHWYFWWD